VTVDTAKVARPVVLGRPEGCLACHHGMTGFSPAHQPEAAGCSSCHGGDPFTLDAARAHRGMVLVPGNIADAARSCGQGACHADIVPRVERAIMTTFAGVIATNRSVFGEDPRAGATAGQPPHARQLGHSAADSHLRQLCVGCHLTTPPWGPSPERAVGLQRLPPEVQRRGGGGPGGLCARSARARRRRCAHAAGTFRQAFSACASALERAGRWQPLLWLPQPQQPHFHQLRRLARDAP
jgi:hypothetical protein